ncbi:uncharacterized protein LOC143433112 isoform X2 [Xylocopa sonorina]|uniref:uncharacterized protein LOC143433112 isoform X2 n=1 Tax=Xylocopa sonorina TaxID=1818115 RepID=UPI00403B2933
MRNSFKDRTPLHSWFKVIIQVLNREEPRYPFQFGDREMGSCFHWWDLVEINNSGKFDKKSNDVKFDVEESYKCGAGLYPIYRVSNTSFKNDKPVDCSRVQHHYA